MVAEIFTFLQVIKVGKLKEQKRLLRCNLREAYQEYKKRTGGGVGLSKFCELRPKQCITVGSNGSHAVYVPVNTIRISN